MFTLVALSGHGEIWHREQKTDFILQYTNRHNHNQKSMFPLGLSFPDYRTIHPFLSFPFSMWVVLKVGGEGEEPTVGDTLQFCCLSVMTTAGIDMLLNALRTQDSPLHQSLPCFKVQQRHG